MTGAALAVRSGGYVDQVKRRRRFEAEHPSAVFRCDPPWWHASMIVGGLRRQIARCTELGDALDDMEDLAAIEAQRLALAEQFRAWHLWLSDEWGWYAVRRGPGPMRAPMTLAADDPAGLRAELFRAIARERSTGMGRRTGPLAGQRRPA